MKKLHAILITLCLLCFICPKLSAQKSIPKLKDRSRKGILEYFKTILENRQVIVGQQCSETADVALNYKKSFTALFDSTGRYPALLGLEYGYYANMDLKLTNTYAIRHWNAGGLVTLSFHPACPWLKGYDVRWNSVKHKDSINIRLLLRDAPESAPKLKYRSELRRAAQYLQELKKQGVVVLWRPFHEANADWFWWGVNDLKSPSNREDFQALWKDMYDTFTNDFGLNNLIWVYAPYAGASWFAPISYMYPGDRYVDMAGVDNYSSSPEFKDYSELIRFNKPIVNGEVGPSKSSYGKFDELEVLHVFQGRSPYFLQWHSWINAKVAIQDNINFRELMNDPAAITLDKIR